MPKFRRTMDFLMEGKLKTHEFYRKLIAEIDTEEEVKSESIGEIGCIIKAFLNERKKREDLKFYGDQQFLHVLADFFGAGLDTTLTTIRYVCVNIYFCIYRNNQMRFLQYLFLFSIFPTSDKKLEIQLNSDTIKEEFLISYFEY